jgi:hypothetical protein
VGSAARRKQLVAGTVLCTALAVPLGLALPVSPSSAQGFFDFLWGNRGSERSNNGWNDRGPERLNEPNRGSSNDRSNNAREERGKEQLNEAPPRRSSGESIRKRLRSPAMPREERDSASVATRGGGLAYCVRLCDGRYFPIQSSGGDPAELCNAFCPAAKTKIYTGGAIDDAVGNDGKRYGKLDTAFVYRQKVVDGCSCNGKDSFGLARLEVSRDPTLRAGDIVARDGALMAFKGSKNNTYTAGDFTPIQTYAKGESNLRKGLSDVKVEPPSAANLSARQNAADASVQAPAQQPELRNRRGQVSR